MKLLIEHHSLYQYTDPVFLEPHYLYFHPATRSHIKLIDFNLKVTPTPLGISARLDAENNLYHQCWFHDKTEFLEVTMSAKVESTSYNPFDFFVDVAREKQQEQALRLFLDSHGTLTEGMQLWVKEIKSNNPDQVNFLLSLCQTISSDWEHAIRYGEHLIEPQDCFNSRKGSCRDLSWMMIQILRTLGYPTRFVSGYCFNPELDGHELHAWVEVWLSGAGWVGLDPTAGLFTTGEYIPVSSSNDPPNTLPVQGTYRGSAESTLKTEVTIRLVEW